MTRSDESIILFWQGVEIEISKRETKDGSLWNIKAQFDAGQGCVYKNTYTVASGVRLHLTVPMEEEMDTAGNGKK